MPQPHRPAPPFLDLAGELADLVRYDDAGTDRWPAISAAIPAHHPRNEDPPAGDPPAGDPPAGDPPAGDPPAGDWTPPTRAEYEAIMRERDEAKAAAASRDRKARERERQAAKDGGRYEELYNDANQRAERLEGLVTTGAIDEAIRAAAGRLNFRNPELAARLIERDGITAELDYDKARATVDPASITIIERRLTEAAQRDGYLLSTGPGPMLPGAGGGGGNGGGNGDANAAMNTAIRKAAGR